jgi:hypothetical protein
MENEVIENKEQEQPELFSYKMNDQELTIPKVIKNADGSTVDLQKIIGHAVGTTKKIERKKIDETKNEYQSLKQEYETIAEKLQELETKDLSEVEKENLKLKKQLQEFEKKTKTFEETATQNFQKFENEKIQSDLFRSISGYDLHNSSQTVKLFKADCSPSLIADEDGNYQTKAQVTIQNEKGEFETIEGNPQEVFKLWISQEEQSYLLKNNLKPGGSTSKTGNMSTVDPSKMSDSEYMQWKMSELNK